MLSRRKQVPQERNKFDVAVTRPPGARTENLNSKVEAKALGTGPPW